MDAKYALEMLKASERSMADLRFQHLVESAKKNYADYTIFSEEVVVDGEYVKVMFHLVGHNASHRFAIGQLPDGRFVERSVGEGAEWDEETDSPAIEKKFYVRDNIGYLGHW
jgi:hypothetical protein